MKHESSDRALNPSDHALDPYDRPRVQQPLWRRRKLLLIALAVIIVLAIAIGVGAGVGLSQSSDGSDSEEDDNDDEEPTVDRSEMWQPEVGSAWQIVLSQELDVDTSSGSLVPDVAVYDIDLFNNPVETIEQLHDLDKRVICYFSAGSYEDWRDDEGDFEEEDLGAELDGWPGERWLRTDSENVREIMKRRLDLAEEKGCDAVDPDNVDGYVSLIPMSTSPVLLYDHSLINTAIQQNENGLSLTEEDAIDYVTFLADEASSRGLAMGLKNAGSIIPDVIDKVQFSVNEQCSQYDECDVFAAFIEEGKPVFHIEYPEDEDAEEFSSRAVREICSEGGRNAGGDGGEGSGDGDEEGDGKGGVLEGFSTVLKTLELDNFVRYCDGDVYEEE